MKCVYAKCLTIITIRILFTNSGVLSLPEKQRVISFCLSSGGAHRDQIINIAGHNNPCGTKQIFTVSEAIIIIHLSETGNGN